MGQGDRDERMHQSPPHKAGVDGTYMRVRPNDLRVETMGAATGWTSLPIPIAGVDIDRTLHLGPLDSNSSLAGDLHHGVGHRPRVAGGAGGSASQ